MTQPPNTTRDPEDDLLNEPGSTTGGFATAWLIGLLLIVAFIIGGIILLIFLADEDEVLDVGVTVEEITEEPEDYLGLTVTVSGEVDDVLTEQLFTIGGDGFGGGILIAAGEPVLFEGAGDDEPRRVNDGDIVQVTGRVLRLSEDDEDSFGEEFGFLFGEGEAEQLEEFEDRPIIAAEDVLLTPRLSRAARLAVDLDDISGDDDGSLEGLLVEVQGEVREVLTEQAFLLHEASEAEEVVVGFEDAVLVVLPRPFESGQLREGALANVRGRVFQFDDDLDEVLDERFAEGDFDFLFEDEIFDAWDDSNVIVATSVGFGPGAVTAQFEDIVTDPSPYLGEVVTVGGELDDVITPNAFTIEHEDDDSFVAESEILVLLREPRDDEFFTEGAFYLVRGEVGFFVEESPLFEDDDEFLDLFGDDEFADFEGRPVIIADLVRVER